MFPVSDIVSSFFSVLINIFDSLKGVGTVLGFKIGYDEWVSAGRLGA